MTRSRAKELLPIITAHAEGKKIQIRLSSGVWNPCSEDLLWIDRVDYRIAPEPLIIYVVAGEDGQPRFDRAANSFEAASKQCYDRLGEFVMCFQQVDAKP